MVSSLLDVQYHDDQFWMFTESPDHEGIANDYDTPRIPEFNDDFEVCSYLTTSLCPHIIVKLWVVVRVNVNVKRQN